MINYKHLTGVPYQYKTADCFRLMQSFYMDNFGIEIKQFVAYPEHWWEVGLNLYMDYYHEAGFRLMDIPLREVKVADAFLCAIPWYDKESRKMRGSVPNHVAVYIGDNHILHHPYGRLSEAVPYKGAVRNFTTGIFRHNDLMNIEHPKLEIDLMDHILPSKRHFLQEHLNNGA